MTRCIAIPGEPGEDWVLWYAWFPVLVHPLTSPEGYNRPRWAWRRWVETRWEWGYADGSNVHREPRDTGMGDVPEWPRVIRVDKDAYFIAPGGYCPERMDPKHPSFRFRTMALARQYMKWCDLLPKPTWRDRVRKIFRRLPWR